MLCYRFRILHIVRDRLIEIFVGFELRWNSASRCFFLARNEIADISDDAHFVVDTCARARARRLLELARHSISPRYHLVSNLARYNRSRFYIFPLLEFPAAEPVFHFPSILVVVVVASSSLLLFSFRSTLDDFYSLSAKLIL